MDELKEAYNTISEWGINEDDFIAQKFFRFMSGGTPDDNSIQLGEFYRERLQIIVDLGLKEAKKLIEKVDEEPDYIKNLPF